MRNWSTRRPATTYAADRFEPSRGGDFYRPGRNESGDIVKALGMTPTASETQRIACSPTANLEAYDYYLRGEQAARTGRASDLREALDFYAKAVALDPNFAEAFAADARAAVNIWRNNLDDERVAKRAGAQAKPGEERWAGAAIEPGFVGSLCADARHSSEAVDERASEEAIESARARCGAGAGRCRGACRAWVRLPGRRPICRSTLLQSTQR